jgi:putative phage-type endonuclease
MNTNRTIITSCPQCGQKNRLKEQTSNVIYKCGRCGSLIKNPFSKKEDPDYPYKEIKLEQGTSEWKQWRLGGFGASDIPVLMGEAFRSIKKLLEEKNGFGGDYQNPAMIEGKMLEPVARHEYSKKVGFDVDPICLQHKDYFWARASLDGITTNRNKVVEIKCGESAYKKARQGEIPKYYYGQLQHILFVTGLDVIDYWCYRPERDGILLKMERDDLYIANLIQKGQEFSKYLS